MNAVLACRLQRVIRRPNTKQFIEIVENNFLPECPVSKRDIIEAENIFGPDLGSLKGKTVQKTPPQVEDYYA